MSVRLPSSARRFAALALVTCGLAALVLAIQTAPAGAVPLTGGALPHEALLTPQIINGKESSISQFPWQVYVLLAYVENGQEGETSCGGSILNSTTILTAAHCTDHEGTTTPYNVHTAEAAMVVVAGASKGLGFIKSGTFHPEPETSQGDEVISVRRDPYYTATPEVKDDVALLTLDKPLEISPAKNTATISLVGAGDTPAPGTTLSISGYGKEEGAEGPEHASNGNLYSTTLTAISSDACRGVAGEINSAVFLCAESATSSTCQGDSGGPLTEGNPAVEVGTVDFGGGKECQVGVPDAFVNLAAPEVRDFIEGSESPPVAARPSSPPVIKPVGPAPVALGPLTCEPGNWSGSPSYSYTFQEENSSAAVLQSGPGNTFTPPAALVGTPLVCIVQASNPGGVTTVRSATTAAVAADTTPPTASITARKCHLQACTLSISASDPNGLALTVTSSAAYQVIAKCPVKKGKKKKKGKQPVCHKTHTVNMPVSVVSPGVYSASATKLPYGEKVTFTALATNAAGLHPASAAVASTTLHKPAKPKKKKKKKKSKKR